MSFDDRMFCFADRAELLGAIFGDGTIEVRGKNGRRVTVGVSDRSAPWLAQVKRLFATVFGRHNLRKKNKNPKTGVTYFEFHITTHDVEALFGVSSKYDAGGRMVPPAWLGRDSEFLRRFIKGLVETDGCFSLDSTDMTPKFMLSQKNDYLSAWFVETLRGLKYPCDVSWAEAAQVNVPAICISEEVQRFGEWLQSDKWIALKERGESIGWEPRSAVVDRKNGGLPVFARDRVVLKTVPVEEQEQWRTLRAQGASIGAIAQHFGRANTVVWSATGDIVPTRQRSAEDLNLKPKPHYPRNADMEAVERWRAAALSGESITTISKRENVPQATINKATCDIRWDQLLAKRELQKNKLARMKEESQGDGRWKGDGHFGAPLTLKSYLSQHSGPADLVGKKFEVMLPESVRPPSEVK